MDMTNRPARLGFLAALVALLLGPLVFGAQTALAHPNQATYYGTDQEPGTIITASIDGETCDSSETDDEGVWVIRIDEGDCNGNATAGATINFHLGDVPAEQSVTWAHGDLRDLELTPAPVVEDDADGMDDAADDGMDDTDATDDGMDDTDAMDDGMDDTDATDDGMDDTDATDDTDGMDDTDATDDTDGMDDTDATDDAEGMTPGDKGDTGHAGFAAASGTSSMLLVLALGVLAAAGVAGARTVTGRVDG